MAQCAVVNLWLFVVGCLGIYFGGTWVVASASRFALATPTRLAPCLAAAAYGASLPQVLTSIQAGARGHGELAVALLLGSNVVTLALMLGVSWLAQPDVGAGRPVRTLELLPLVAATLALSVILIDGKLSPWESSALLVAGAVHLAWLARAASVLGDAAAVEARAKQSAEAAETVGKLAARPAGRALMLALFGGGLLVLGGTFFVTASASLAASIGMSERVMGLTLAALAISLPQLSAGIAALRHQPELAVRNVFTANAFTTLLGVGVVGCVSTIDGPGVSGELAWLVALAVIATLFAALGSRRWHGLLLLAVYIGFTKYVLTNAEAPPQPFIPL